MKTQFFPRQAISTIPFALDSHYTVDAPYRVWFDVDNSSLDEKDLFLKISFSRNSKSSAWNPNFFSGQGIPIFFPLHSHFTGDTPYRVWFDLDNSLTLFLKFSKITNSRKSQNSVWKPNFFPRQAIPTILFALDSHYTGDTPFRVWFDLDNSLTRRKRIFFKILKNSQFAKFAKFRMKTHFFPRQALPTFFFALHSHYTCDTPYRVSLDLDNSLTRWKRPTFIIPFSQNSKRFVWTPNFFPSQAIEKILFALHFHYTGDTQCRVWFDLGNSLTRWKLIIFKILKNSQFAKFAKFRMKTHFFPRQAIPATFWLYTVITLVILNPEFGLIWATPWPDEKQLFLIFSKIRNSRISQNTVWKLIFFLGKLYQQLFRFTLSLQWWYSTPSLVWFGQLLDPLEKNFFNILKNSQFANFAKFRMKTHFFPGQAIPKILFALHFCYTGYTQCRVWFDLGNSLTRWKASIFKILKNSKFSKFAKFRMKNHFSPRQALPTTFFLYTLITLVILNTEFGLIWTTPWPDEKQVFLKFSKIRNSRNSQNSVWKTIFLLGKLYQQFFFFTLSLHWWYSIPSLVWIGQLLDPMRSNYF